MKISVSKKSSQYTNKLLQDHSKSGKSTIEFDAGETLEQFFSLIFLLDKYNYFVYISAL
jgi:hypothetical protein